MMKQEKEATPIALTKDDEQRIYAAVEKMNQIQDSDSKNVKAAKTQKAEAIRLYQKKYSRAKSSKSAPDIPKRLSYERLEEFMGCAGLSYRDLFEICGGEDGNRVKLTWAKPSEEEMCKLLDACSENEKAAVKDLIMDALPVSIKAALTQAGQSAERLFVLAGLRERVFDESNRLIQGDVQMRSARDNWVSSGAQRKRIWKTIGFSKYAKITKDFDVSYHWLSNLGPDKTILAKTGSTEEIMDAFCLLPDDIKAMILAGAKFAKKEA